MSVKWCVVSRVSKALRGFPGGSLDKNPSVNAEDTGSIPGPGGSHPTQMSRNVETLANKKLKIGRK